MKRIARFRYLLAAVAFAAAGSGCTPEIGSEKWCAALEEKPAGDWTVNEAADYTKHCLFKTR